MKTLILTAMLAVVATSKPAFAGGPAGGGGGIDTRR